VKGGVVEVKELLRGGAVTIHLEESLRSAASLLVSEGIGALLVTNKNKLVGVLSERDVLAALDDEEFDDATIWDYAALDPFTVMPETSVGEAARVMVDKGIRHLPIVGEDGHLHGVVSMRDLLFAALNEASAEARRDWWDYLLQGFGDGTDADAG